MKPPRPLLRRTLGPLLVLLAGAAFLLPGLGRTTMTREQELRVALTARTMANGGSWTRPVFLGEARLRKPPLMYWAVASSYQVAGTTASATAARLPSALAGLLTMGLLYALAAPALGRRRAALSALVCGTSFIFIKQARLAETDLLLCLGTTVAALALYRGLASPRRWQPWALAGVAAGLGFMSKGPAALALPLLAALTFTLTTPRVRQAWSAGKGSVFALLFLLIALPWYAIILGDPAGLAQVRDEIQRATTTSEHAGPWFYYAYTLFQACAPWSLALPFALFSAWRHRQRTLLRFALCWLGSSFLALSLLESKQLHYALLLVPPASLLIGAWLGRAWVPHRRNAAGRLLTLFCVVAMAGGFALLGAAAWGDFNLPFRPLLVGGIYATLAGGAGLWLRHSAGLRLVLFLCAWLALTWTIALQIMPVRTKERVIEEAVLLSRGSLQQAPHIIFSGPRNAIAEFYADRPLEVVLDPGRAWRKARSGDAVIVVAKPEQLRLPAEPTLIKSSDRMSCAILIKPR